MHAAAHAPSAPRPIPPGAPEISLLLRLVFVLGFIALIGLVILVQGVTLLTARLSALERAQLEKVELDTGDSDGGARSTLTLRWFDRAEVAHTVLTVSTLERGEALQKEVGTSLQAHLYRELRGLRAVLPEDLRHLSWEGVAMVLIGGGCVLIGLWALLWERRRLGVRRWLLQHGAVVPGKQLDSDSDEGSTTVKYEFRVGERRFTSRFGAPDEEMTRFGCRSSSSVPLVAYDPKDPDRSTIYGFTQP